MLQQFFNGFLIRKNFVRYCPGAPVCKAYNEKNNLSYQTVGKRHLDIGCNCNYYYYMKIPLNTEKKAIDMNGDIFKTLHKPVQGELK